MDGPLLICCLPGCIIRVIKKIPKIKNLEKIKNMFLEQALLLEFLTATRPCSTDNSQCWRQLEMGNFFMGLTHQG